MATGYLVDFNTLISGEGGYIRPTKDYGYDLLEAVGKSFQQDYINQKSFAKWNYISS